MERPFDNNDPRGVGLSRVGWVGIGAGTAGSGQSSPPVASEPVGVGLVQGSTEFERAVCAAWEAGRLTAELEPENLENAAIDVIAGFLLAYGRPHIEEQVHTSLGVYPGLSQETYAEIGVFLGDLLYHRYLRN